MSKAYSKIFWGAFITLFNINIGWLNLLPNFIGYILIAVGLSGIIKASAPRAGAEGSAGTGRVLAVTLAVYSFVMMLTNTAFTSVIGAAVTVIFMTVELIMCRSVLSAGECEANAEILPKQQRIYLIITTIAIVSVCINIVLPGLVLLTLALSLASKIYFMYLCRVLKKDFCDDEDYEEDGEL